MWNIRFLLVCLECFEIGRVSRPFLRPSPHEHTSKGRLSIRERFMGPRGTERNDKVVGNGDDEIPSFPWQDCAVGVAQPKLASLWLLKANLETCIELADRSMPELHEPGNELPLLLDHGEYLHISRVPALGHPSRFEIWWAANVSCKRSGTLGQIKIKFPSSPLKNGIPYYYYYSVIRFIIALYLYISCAIRFSTSFTYLDFLIINLPFTFRPLHFCCCWSSSWQQWQ